MKTRKLLLLALSAIALVGCMKSEIDEATINSSNAISFSTSTDKLTKASVLDNDFEDGDDFGLYAYHTVQSTWAEYTASSTFAAPNFMNNQTVTYSDNAWTYSPTKYWPNTSGDMISFFAYMPKNEAGDGYDSDIAKTSAAYGENAFPIVTFTQVMDAEKMTDFVVAKTLDQTKTTSPVTLSFEHVLTRLNFSAQTTIEDANTKAFVKSIEVVGGSSAKLWQTAYYNINDSAWTTYALYGQNLVVTPILSTAEVTFGDYTNNAAVAVTANTTATSLLKTNDYLFLIPPSTAGVESTSDIQFNVEYDMVTKDDQLNSDQVSENSVTFSMPNGTLLSGVAYNVVLTFDMEGIVVAANIVQWEEEESYNTALTEFTVNSVSSLENAMTQAFDAEVEEATIEYKGEVEENIAITIPDSETTTDLYLDFTGHTGTIAITTNDDYAGELTIDAPNATVTIDGGTYENLTVWTAASTLYISEGTTVDGLTINAGNVAVYGTLDGDISLGNSNSAATITFMSGSTNTIDNKDDGITVSDVPTDDGIYYSLDSGAWESYSATTDIDGSTTSYSAIKLITVGSTTTISTTHTSAIFSNNALKSADLSGATFSKNYAYWENAPTNTQLEEFYYPGNIITISGTLAGVTTLKKIVLPDCTELIASSLFNGCTSLTSINLENVKIIQNSVFQGCTSLESVDLSSLVNTAQLYNSSEELTSYTTSGSAFQDCTSLKDVTLGEGLTEIPTYFFNSCTSLKEIDLTHVVTIGSYSFRYSGLESVTLGEGLTTIEKYAFQYSALKEVNIPSTVTDIGDYQFAYTDLETITFANRDDGATDMNIGTYFMREAKITSFTFPKNCGTLGTHFLFNTPELKTVDFNGVTYLPRACFYKSGLESLYIPNYIDLNSTSDDDGHTFRSMPNLKTFEIQDSGTTFTMTNYVLYENPVLETVTFPSTLLGFSGITMANCPMLSTIVCKATTVPTTTETDFGYINTDGSNYYTGCSVTGAKILYVPAGSVDAYNAKATDGTDNIVETLDGEGNITSTNENFWKTVLIDVCGFEVKPLTDLEE